MKESITISELSKREVKRILVTEKFNALAPVVCKDCGYKRFFTRRIFKLEGTRDMREDDSQNLIRWHMRKNYGLDNVFFKICNGIDYVDTAFCGKCNSNIVVYDISLDEHHFDELAKFVDMPKDILKKNMRKIYDKLS